MQNLAGSKKIMIQSKTLEDQIQVNRIRPKPATSKKKLCGLDQTGSKQSKPSKKICFARSTQKLQNFPTHTEAL
jgi:hypothetical protein